MDDFKWYAVSQTKWALRRSPIHSAIATVQFDRDEMRWVFSLVDCPSMGTYLTADDAKLRAETEVLR